MFWTLSRRRLGMIALALTAPLALTACGTSAPPAAAPAAAPDKPAAAAAPAAAPPAASKLFVVDSVVRGSTNLTDAEKPTLSCVMNSKFLRNEQLVWRIKVLDPVTGKELDDKALDKVQVKLADGKTFDAKFGIRPKDKPTDGFWTTSFNIPADYPPGTLNYAIEASTKDGRGSQFVKFAMAASSVTVLPEVRPVVVKK